MHLLVILQNTKALPEAGGPKSWSDLLDPKWKGKIAFTDPANSGSAYSNATMLVEQWGGGDAGWEKLKALFANTRVLNRSTLVFQGVGNGEYPLGHVARICRSAVGEQRRAGEGRSTRRTARSR